MNKRKGQRRSGKDRRKNSDRRNGLDRRRNGFKALAENDILFNTKEACEYLQVSRPTFLNLIKEGKIKAKKIGRGWKVFKSDLDFFLRC